MAKRHYLPMLSPLFEVIEHHDFALGINVVGHYFKPTRSMAESSSLVPYYGVALHSNMFFHVQSYVANVISQKVNKIHFGGTFWRQSSKYKFLG